MTKPLALKQTPNAQRSTPNIQRPMQKNSFRSSMFSVRCSAFDVFCRLNRGAYAVRSSALDHVVKFQTCDF